MEMFQGAAKALVCVDSAGLTINNGAVIDAQARDGAPQ